MAPKTITGNTLFDQLQKDAQGKSRLGDMQEKVDALRQSNREYVQTFKRGTKRVLEGGQREQQELTALEKSVQQGKEFTGYVAETVRDLTGEFGAVEEYLGDVTKFQGLEWLTHLFSTQKAEGMRTKRVLKASLAENLTQILNYYATMKGVMYQAAVENQTSINEIRAVRQTTVEKLNEKDSEYNQWQQTRKECETKLGALEQELSTLTGERRAQKEQERVTLRDELTEAQNNEDLAFSVVKNARGDLQYQEENLKNYESVARALVIAISDMQEKIDNRTVLFDNIEVLIKTSYRVKSASLADAAMNKTLAQVTQAAAIQTEGILDELGQRAKAKVMSPEELEQWKKRSSEARKRFEADIDLSKTEYAQPTAAYR